MNRRQFLQSAGAAAMAAALPALPLGAAETKLKSPTADHLPRWRGFNLLEKFVKQRQDNPPFREDDFVWLADWGFDFARLPMSYLCWSDPSDWLKLREEGLKDVDGAVELGRKHGVHVNLNLHRAPGYCVNPPKEPLDLWTDERALEACAFHWAHFARRYKGIPNDRLSFDLLNEPGDIPEATYVRVVKRLVEAIRAEDPQRLIIADGLKWGTVPVHGLARLGIAQSTRGYEPIRISHYRASWMHGSDKWPEPTWPLQPGQKDEVNKETLRRNRIQPWKDLEQKGVGIHVGEWGAFNRTPHKVVLAWMRDCLALWREAGWGWSLWEFRGGFGILDSQRADVAYEDFHGHKLDREMLTLLRNADAETARRREERVEEKGESDFWILLRAWEEAAKNGFRVEVCRSLGLNATAARQVGPLLRQFLDIAQREGFDTTQRPAPAEALQKCILTAFSDRVARRLEGTQRCEMVHGRRGTLARESAVRTSPLLVAAEVKEVEGKDKNVSTVLSLATAIDGRWLQELFPEDISSSPRVYYDAVARRVYAEEQLRFRDLAIGTRRVEPPPADAAAHLLAEEVLAGRLTLNDWDEGVEQWILRLNQLSQWCPELGLPPVREEDRRHLVEQLCHGAFGYKEIKDKPVKSEVRGWLSPAQQDLLERHAPERLRLANGRTPKVVYAASAPPHIALRIQELYDVNTTPRIAMGRTPVLVHILAPSRRPVQITQDLAGFWREHYPRVKRELQRKYPKHEWR